MPESEVMEAQSVGDWAGKRRVSGSCPSSGQKLEGVLDVGEVGRSQPPICSDRALQ